jgi:rfaE bifunctional protein nucleotidyltransferase chain/domain
MDMSQENHNVDLKHEKVVSTEQGKLLLQKIRDDGGISVFTNGCFDILHPGHIQYLEKARRLGDVLVIGLNSDSSIRSIKGPERPISEQNARAYMLASLACVDYIVLFDEDTPTRLIEELRPNILVKGADWEGKKLPGSDAVDRVEYMTFLPGWSTTDIITRIQTALKKEQR